MKTNVKSCSTGKLQNPSFDSAQLALSYAERANTKLQINEDPLEFLAWSLEFFF